MENKSKVKAFTQGQVIMVPKFLFGEEYRDLSTDAKIIYALLWDNYQTTHGGIDEEGKTYQEFRAEDARNFLKCSPGRVTKMFKDLEDFGLVIRKRKPCQVSRFYILREN